MRGVKFSWLLKTAVVIGLFLSAGGGLARAETTKPRNNQDKKPGQDKQPGEKVEMFAGIKAGQIEVKFIPKDSTQGRIFIKNKTDKPLRVELPKAAGAVPILAQMGGMGGGMGGMGGRGGQMQSMGMGGGGMGGMGGGGMGGGGMGGGMFNVAPEKVAEVKVACVCLEHGKAEPRSTANYELRPIEKVTTKAGVRELCGTLGQVPQRVVQAAAWHLSSGMTWQQLIDKRIERADGSSYPYFDPAEINMAMALADQSVKAAAEQPKGDAPVSPGQSVSQAR